VRTSTDEMKGRPDADNERELCLMQKSVTKYPTVSRAWNARKN